jgi:uncharacterized membrane protein
MKNVFKLALKTFGYTSLLFFLIYLVIILVDDQILIQAHGITRQSLAMWGAYFGCYYLLYALCFWLVALLIIFIFKSDENSKTDSNSNQDIGNS